MRNFAVRQLRVVTMLAIIWGGTGAGTAFADAVQANVTIPANQPTPVMTENGTGYTPGTYAVGTIHLNYTMVGMKFLPGSFAAFQLNLLDISSSGKAPEYPVSLALEQVGGDVVNLSPSNSPLAISGIGWDSSVLVTVSISDSVAADPALNI